MSARRMIPFAIVVVLLAAVTAFWKKAPSEEQSMNKHLRTNRLANETSPYLLQHQHNPVDWYPWGEEALQKAKELDRPIFLSIGYSACHWCHVMERESFENEAIAAVMNEHFICIKVDREERPDLDEIYMSAVHAMTGSGGWPMSVFLTPDLKPFYGGTYFPPEDHYGRPGFMNVLKNIAQAYKERRNDINRSAEQLTRHIQDSMTLPPSTEGLDDSVIENAFVQLKNRFDPQDGGFGGAPKFPHTMDLGLLLRYQRKTGNQNALHIAEFTLERMARGGMYDQIGGGFHRYSTDARWLIPHFEKMLYDNALLAKIYLEAFQITKKPFYRRIAQETLDYVLREMTSPEGGFYSSQDADSEGKEGVFFVWTPEQIAEVLGEEKSRIVCQYYGVDEKGNFEHGTSALHTPNDEETAAEQLEISVAELTDTVSEAKVKLFAARGQRIEPGRDDKILTDWNGLMISAFAFAGNVFDEPRYTQAAEKACGFLLEYAAKDGFLLHTWKNGRAHTNAFLSDYAFLIQALLDTYEASGTVRWLSEALRLSETAIERFHDPQGGGFFFTANGASNLIARSKNPMDQSIPSGNSIMILSLLRLSEMTGNRHYLMMAEEAFQSFASGLQKIPAAYTQMIGALDFMQSLPKEIVLTGSSFNALSEFRNTLYDRFLPNKTVLYAYPETLDSLAKLSPPIEGKTPLNGLATAYVCQNFTCRQPVTTTQELLAELDR